MTDTASAYDQRQADKKARLEARAATVRAEGEAQADEARTFFAGIQGQPMLPGHHSYRTDRNRRRKNGEKWDRGIAKQKDADELDRRAKAVGSAGVASDDPEAVRKLREKLAWIDSQRAKIKKVNGIVRKFAPKQRPGDDYDPEALTAALQDAGIDDALIREVLKRDFTGRVGIEQWVLENKTKEARRITKRIEELEALNEATSGDVEWSGPDWEMWVDTTAGRIFLEIEGRLTRDSFADIRRAGGFNWSRKERRYVRKVTANALRSAESLVARIDDLIEFE